jgi:hypothetical protein
MDRPYYCALSASATWHMGSELASRRGAVSDWGGYGTAMEEVLAQIVCIQTPLSADGQIRRAEMAEWCRGLDDREIRVVRSTFRPAFEGTIPA